MTLSHHPSHELQTPLAGWQLPEAEGAAFDVMFNEQSPFPETMKH